MPPSLETALARLDELGRLSDSAEYLMRTFLSPANQKASSRVLDWMSALGMELAHAPDGTVRGVLPGKNPHAPPLLLGSHIDTVINAGKYDGPLGIISSLAALENLAEEGHELPFPVHLFAFSDEEGVRFQSTYLGSRGIVGDLDQETLALTDATGQSLTEVITSEGWHQDSTRFHYHPGKCLGYIELHIEQGRILEEAQEPACIVSSIVGQTRLAITITGQADHAGTTPMEIRKDALTGAAEVILFVEKIARETRSLIATVGRLEVLPGASNSIPQEVRFTIDIRDPDNEVRRKAEQEIHRVLDLVGESRSLAVVWQEVQSNDATPCHPELTKQLLDSLHATTAYRETMPSGAGHDGVVIAQAMPIGMIFIRCREGLSHHPDEYASPEDIEVGIQILTHFLKNLDPTLLNSHG